MGIIKGSYTSRELLFVYPARELGEKANHLAGTPDSKRNSCVHLFTPLVRLRVKGLAHYITQT